MSLTRRGFFGAVAGVIAAVKLGPALVEAAPAVSTCAAPVEATLPYSIPAYINEYGDAFDAYRLAYQAKQRAIWDDMNETLERQLWAVPESRKMTA